MTPQFPEPGYTPFNLRALIEARGWTQKQAAAVAGVAERTVRGWLVDDLDSPQHRDCPLKTWRKIIQQPVT